MDDKLLLYVKNGKKFYKDTYGKYTNSQGLHMWIYEDKLAVQHYNYWYAIVWAIFLYFLILPIPIILVHGIIEYHSGIKDIFDIISTKESKSYYRKSDQITIDAKIYFQDKIHKEASKHGR